MTVQMVILLPVVFLVMFTAVQAGLWFHARAVALGAAAEGARVAGAETGTGPAGAASAADFVIAAGGDGVLLHAATTGTRGTEAATVTVTGAAQSVIPGWAPPVEQSATVPVERITAPTGGFTNPEAREAGTSGGTR